MNLNWFLQRWESGDKHFETNFQIWDELFNLTCTKSWHVSRYVPKCRIFYYYGRSPLMIVGKGPMLGQIFSFLTLSAAMASRALNVRGSQITRFARLCLLRSTCDLANDSNMTGDPSGIFPSSWQAAVILPSQVVLWWILLSPLPMTTYWRALWTRRIAMEKQFCARP